MNYVMYSVLIASSIVTYNECALPKIQDKVQHANVLQALDWLSKAGATLAQVRTALIQQKTQLAAQLLEVKSTHATFIEDYERERKHGHIKEDLAPINAPADGIDQGIFAKFQEAQKMSKLAFDTLYAWLESPIALFIEANEMVTNAQNLLQIVVPHMQAPTATARPSKLALPIQPGDIEKSLPLQNASLEGRINQIKKQLSDKINQYEYKTEHFMSGKKDPKGSLQKFHKDSLNLYAQCLEDYYAYQHSIGTQAPPQQINFVGALGLIVTIIRDEYNQTTETITNLMVEINELTKEYHTLEADTKRLEKILYNVAHNQPKIILETLDAIVDTDNQEALTSQLNTIKNYMNTLPEQTLELLTTGSENINLYRGILSRPQSSQKKYLRELISLERQQKILAELKASYQHTHGKGQPDRLRFSAVPEIAQKHRKTILDHIESIEKAIKTTKDSH